MQPHSVFFNFYTGFELVQPHTPPHVPNQVTKQPGTIEGNYVALGLSNVGHKV